MTVSDELFEDWVRQYHRLLYGIAYWWTGSAPDAEEIVQEAFYQAYRSRASLRDEAAAKSWLVGILRHCYGQLGRKRHQQAEVPLEDVTEPVDGLGLPLQERLALHQSLARIEERYRLPLVLFYFQELSYREIAESMELPLGTVMSRLARGREMLHSRLSAAPRLSIVKKREVR